ncbi:MAG: PrgI family protein [Candidatus Paceibacterota bacterium]
MANFQVPQFIEGKAKIVGPLTMSQFIYVGIASGISVIAFYTLGFFLWVVISILSLSLGISLAFVKINGQDFPSMIRSAINFWQKPKIYSWQRQSETTTLDVSSIQRIEAARRDMSLQQKLKSAALSISTGDFSLFRKKSRSKPKERYQVVRHLTGEKSLAKRVDYKSS